MSNITPLKTPEDRGGDFEQTPKGVFIVRCYKMVDIGTQQVTYTPPGGKPVVKPTRQIILYWEILRDQKGQDVFMEDGERRFSIQKTYTWSMNRKANLRALLDAWRGEPFTDEEANGFDMTKVLGTYCQMQIVHNLGKGANAGKTYANVGTVMHADPIDVKYNEAASFSIENPDMEMFEQFPEWLRNKIEDAEEWSGGDEPEEQEGHITDDGQVEVEDEEPGISKKKLVKKNPF